MARMVSPTSSRRAAAGGLRTRILGAAFEQFERGGLDAISMRAVAADVGMSPMGIYRYYEDRDALIDALVDRGLESFERHLAAVPARPPGLAYLRRLLRAYVDFALEHRATFHLLFLSTRYSDEPFLQDYKAGTSPSFEILRRAVKSAMDSGELTPRNSVDAALAIWALAHGLVALFLAGRFGEGEPLFRRFCMRSFDLFVRGMQ